MKTTEAKRTTHKKLLRPKPSFDDRINQIYSKAAALFAQNGYINTNMNQIATVANLKKGGLYHYIKNKEMLLFEILDRTLDTFLERADNLVMEGLPPEKKLRLLLDEYTTTLVRFHNEVILIVLASRYLRPKLRDTIHSKRLRYEEHFYSIISEGLSKKVFTKHDDKETLGFLIIGAIFNYFLWHPGELKGDVKKKIESFTRFFLNGLLVR